MGLIRDMATKKAKERISSKASLLSPLEKMAESINLKDKIDKKLGKKEVTSESFVEKSELKEEVKENAEKIPRKNFKESFVKRVIKTSLGILGFGIGKEVLSKKATETVSETAAEVLTDDEKLKKANDELEKQINDKSSLLNKFNKEKDPEKRKKLKEKIKKYRADNFQFIDMLKDTWQETAVDENGKSRGIFSHLWHSIGRFFSNVPFFFGIKKAKKNGIFEMQDELEALRAKEKEAVKSAKTKYQEYKQVSRAGVKLKNSRKIRKMITAKDLVKDFNEDVSGLQRKFSQKKLSPRKFAKAVEEANINLFKRAKETGRVEELVSLMKKGKVSGLEIPAKFSQIENNNMARRFTKLKINPMSMGIAGALTISAFNAKRKGSFREFFRSLTSKETLTEAFIPGVGTWRSIKRNWHNSQSPTWLKITDIGLNVVGDVMLTAGYISSIFSFGSGAAAGIAGRTALLGLGKGLLKREGIEIAAKQMGKTIVAKETRQAALKFAGKSLKEGVKASAISSAVMLSMQIAMKKFFNKDKVNEAFNEMLSKEQQRSIKLMKQAEAIGQAA